MGDLGQASGPSLRCLSFEVGMEVTWLEDGKGVSHLPVTRAMPGSTAVAGSCPLPCIFERWGTNEPTPKGVSVMGDQRCPPHGHSLEAEWLEGTRGRWAAPILRGSGRFL